jgi:transcription elongation GreA/GreB family factor
MDKDNIKKISIGDTVKVRLSGGEVKTFKIVITSQSNPSEGLISDISPLGKVLLGASKGEKKKYMVNGKEFEVEII